MNGDFIRVHAAAPSKPTTGSTCNGCGACCAAEPCPLSLVLLGHRAGPCPALAWDGAGSRYRCGLAEAPADYLSLWPACLNRLGARAARRWISAGTGCDFDAEVGEP